MPISSRTRWWRTTSSRRSRRSRGVVLEYRSEAGTELTADVDPWSVVARAGRWYLLCYAHHVTAVRTYRVDRIRSVTRTTRRVRPAGATSIPSPRSASTSARAGATRPASSFAAPLDEVQHWIRPPMGRPRTARGRVRADRHDEQPRDVRAGVAVGPCRSRSASRAATSCAPPSPRSPGSSPLPSTTTRTRRRHPSTDPRHRPGQVRGDPDARRREPGLLPSVGAWWFAGSLPHRADSC